MNSRAEIISRTMATMGFVPKVEIDARYVEYYKDYAEPHGRSARCVALFDKSGVFNGLDQARLAGFVVTVQGIIDPIAEEVKTKAPRVMHADMLRSVADLGVFAAEPQAIAAVECAACGSTTAEWVDVEGKPTCLACRGEDK